MSQLTQHAGMYIGQSEDQIELVKDHVHLTSVHILDGITDDIVQTLDNTLDNYFSSDASPVSIFWDDEHQYSLKDEGKFDFKTAYNGVVKGRNRVIVPSEGGDFFHEFIIDEVKDPKEETYREVYATPSYLDLRRNKPIQPQTMENYTVQLAGYAALGQTEWDVGIIESADTKTISVDQEITPYALIKKIATEFDLELRFRIEVYANRVIGRYVDFLEQLGTWNGKEITMGKDLIGVERVETSDEIVTALVVIGPETEDEDGNTSRITAEVMDDEARQRWGRNGEHLWKIHEPETDREELSVDRLRTIGRTELNKRKAEAVTYEADVVGIEHVFGFEHEEVRLGDTVRIKDTSYTPYLYMEARVFDINRSLADPSVKTYTLGDFVLFEADDIESQMSKLRAKIARKIGLDTLERYAERKRHEGPEPPEDTSKVWIDTSRSPNVVKTFNAQEGDWVRSTPIYASEVDAYNRSEIRQRIEAAEQAMNTAAENYAMQYSETYYEDNITSAVQEAKTYSDDEIAAAKNEMGADISELEGAVEIRAYQTEVDSIEGRMSQAESTISAQSDEIDLKVNVDDIITRINLSEEAVLIAGNRVQITGETFIDDAVITNAMIDSLHGGKIQAETITSTALAVQYLSAISSDLGTINAGEVNAKVLTSGTALLDRFRGGTLALGGSEYGDGHLTVMLDDETTIGEISKEDIAFKTLTVGDVRSNSVISYLSDDVTYYVRYDGDDEQDGMSWDTSLNTVQEALDRLPKFIDGEVRIEVFGASGTSYCNYWEGLQMKGFIGGGQISVIGTAGDRSATFHNSFNLRGCSVPISLQRFTVNGDPGSEEAIMISSCAHVTCNNLEMDGKHDIRDGIRVDSSSYAQINGGTKINNFIVAGVSIENGSKVYAYYPEGRNEQVGYYVRASSLVGLSDALTGDNNIYERSTGGRVDGNFNESNAPGSTSSGTSTITKRFTPSDSESWRSNYNHWRGGSDVYQGQYSGYGLHRGLWFYNDLKSTVQGKTIRDIKVKLKRKNEGGSSRAGTFTLRMHGYSSKPGGQPSFLSPMKMFQAGWGDTVTVTLPSSWHSYFEDGDAEGVGLYSSSSSPYGIFEGNAEIKISYNN